MAAVFERSGAIFRLHVIVETTTTMTGAVEVSEVAVRLVAGDADLRPDREVLGQLTLVDGRRWHAYFVDGQFILTNVG
jgi:hypothetical protein